MLYKSMLAATLMSGMAFASDAEAGHTDPTVRLGVDVIWGGGYLGPPPVAWYPAPVYSYAPPPAYGRPYWAGKHRRDHRHERRYDDRRDSRHDDWRDSWRDDRHDDRGRRGH